MAPFDQTPAAKRAQLLDFTGSELELHSKVMAVVVIGSVATGRARPDSDIDAMLFMSPIDTYIVPGESVWRPRDNTFHSIFSDDPSLEAEGVQLDLHRVDLD